MTSMRATLLIAAATLTTASSNSRNATGDTAPVSGSGVIGLQTDTHWPRAIAGMVRVLPSSETFKHFPGLGVKLDLAVQLFRGSGVHEGTVWRFPDSSQVQDADILSLLKNEHCKFVAEFLERLCVVRLKC